VSPAGAASGPPAAPGDAGHAVGHDLQLQAAGLADAVRDVDQPLPSNPSKGPVRSKPQAATATAARTASPTFRIRDIGHLLRPVRLPGAPGGLP
jgi:hypothetical protein